jgi:SHS family lactate transporter-like MFS transporter
LQATLAARHGGDFGLALALVAGVVAVAIALASWFGAEARGVAFGGASASSTPRSAATRSAA